MIFPKEEVYLYFQLFPINLNNRRTVYLLIIIYQVFFFFLLIQLLFFQFLFLFLYQILLIIVYQIKRYTFILIKNALYVLLIILCLIRQLNLHVDFNSTREQPNKYFYYFQFILSIKKQISTIAALSRPVGSNPANYLLSILILSKFHPKLNFII